MTQVAMLSRLVEWFANQEPVIQSGIMGHYPPEVEVDIAKLLLKRMGDGSTKAARGQVIARLLSLPFEAIPPRSWRYRPRRRRVAERAGVPVWQTPLSGLLTSL
jgi:hypothetical protein